MKKIAAALAIAISAVTFGNAEAAVSVEHLYSRAERDAYYQQRRAERDAYYQQRRAERDAYYQQRRAERDAYYQQRRAERGY